MRRFLATALLGSAVALAPAASASAQAPSTLTTSDGVLFQTCVHHPISYAASPGSGNWSLFLSSTRSDGSQGPFVSLSSALGDQSSGTTTLDFCGYGGSARVYVPGRYTRPLHGAAGVYDYGGTWSRKFRWLGALARAQFEAETRGNDLLDRSTSEVVHLTTAHRGSGR
jgi:hypothetical protein